MPNLYPIQRCLSCALKNTKKLSKEDRDWVYRADYECVVFAPRRWYDWHMQIIEAMEKARTWAEFEALMPEDEFADVIAHCFDAEGYEVEPEDARPRPSPQSPFSADQVLSCYDGVYPRGLMERMSEWLPPDLFKKYAKLTGNPGWGAWSEIELDDAEELAEEMRRRGYELAAHPGHEEFF